MKASRLLSLRFALIIASAYFFNIASAQNVRTKPVVSKPTTTKKTSTVKKQTKNTSKTVSYPVRNLQLQEFLNKPLGIIDIDLNNKATSFSKIESAIKKRYNIDTSSSIPNKELELHEFAHPSLEALRYQGLRFTDFNMYNSNENYWRYISYSFEIKTKDMTKSWSEYLEDIINDFHQLGIPITFKETTDKKWLSVIGEGEIQVDDIRYYISIQDFSKSKSEVYHYHITKSIH